MTNEPVTPLGEREGGNRSGPAISGAPTLSGIAPDIPQPLSSYQSGTRLLRMPPRPGAAARERRVSIVCASCDLINHADAAEFDRDLDCEHCGKPLFQRCVFDLGEANFDLHICASYVPTAVVFWAPWCKPCHSVLALIELAARELEPRLRFARVNIDDERGLVTRNGIRGIPTLLLFRRGKEAARRIGSIDFQLIRGWAVA
ncbi:MAG: thioredoxin domain-containing protein [Betaproteobacteria bacterium]|nr:thioredoxin domain-containing protein [Betaproteobacteria bacterium]